VSDEYKNIPAGDQETIPILEEHIRLDKQEVVTGRVQVRIRNESEERRLQADLRTEAVDVERIAIGRELAAGETLPAPREEEDGSVLVIPVLEEVLVVEKRLVLREEVRLRRTSSTRQIEEPVTVLRQHAEVERLPPAGGPGSE
jgi:uncharacterized protein (TIGR02271 family)